MNRKWKTQAGVLQNCTNLHADTHTNTHSRTHTCMHARTLTRSLCGQQSNSADTRHEADVYTKQRQHKHYRIQMITEMHSMHPTDNPALITCWCQPTTSIPLFPSHTSSPRHAPVFHNQLPCVFQQFFPDFSYSIDAILHHYHEKKASLMCGTQKQTSVPALMCMGNPMFFCWQQTKTCHTMTLYLNFIYLTSHKITEFMFTYRKCQFVQFFSVPK